jgi:hypothetical protein
LRNFRRNGTLLHIYTLTRNVRTQPRFGSEPKSI